MILYQLVCENDHSFEGWFRDSAGYDEQVAQGELACPLCGSPHVRKAPMAPRLSRRKGGGDVVRGGGGTSSPSSGADTDTDADAGAAGTKAVSAGATDADMGSKVRAVLHDLRRQVEAQCDYVGDRFAEEARKIHYGETDARPIYGETSKAEAETLKDEGVEFVSVPWLKADG